MRTKGAGSLVAPYMAVSMVSWSPFILQTHWHNQRGHPLAQTRMGTIVFPHFTLTALSLFASLPSPKYRRKNSITTFTFCSFESDCQSLNPSCAVCSLCGLQEAVCLAFSSMRWGWSSQYIAYRVRRGGNEVPGVQYSVTVPQYFLKSLLNLLQHCFCCLCSGFFGLQECRISAASPVRDWTHSPCQWTVRGVPMYNYCSSHCAIIDSIVTTNTNYRTRPLGSNSDSTSH